MFCKKQNNQPDSMYDMYQALISRVAAKIFQPMRFYLVKLAALCVESENVGRA